MRAVRSRCLLMAMSEAAFSVKVVSAVQDSGAATVIVPACVPEDPVETVTFAADRAVSSVVALITLSSPLAVKPELLLLEPAEIVTL